MFKKISFLIIFSFLLYFLSLFNLRAEITENSVLKKREQLERELSVLENQIEEYRGLIKNKQKDAATFERDITILNAKIKKSLLEIQARKLSISRLTDNISERAIVINNLSEKIVSEKLSLAEFVRRINELDETSLLELFLKYNSLSDFFVELDSYDTVQAAMRDSLFEIRDTRSATEKEKEKFEKQKDQELELKTIQELQKRRIEEDKGDKNNLLNITKGEEKKYQQILSERQKKAATIRSALFTLRGSPAIPFEKALQYANIASKSTRIRPAFLLGIIAEESNLGANVGTGNWKEDLSHPKCAAQKKAFQEITSKLGLDPDQVPVSKRAWYGNCGGAMGPAQFMPTTWLSYESLVSKKTGNNPPNPWNPLDAFTASALLLKDNGGAGGDYNDEWKAAMRYLAGGNWNNPSYRFYGDDVMALAKKYQEQIDILEEN